MMAGHTGCPFILGPTPLLIPPLWSENQAISGLVKSRLIPDSPLASGEDRPMIQAVCEPTFRITTAQRNEPRPGVWICKVGVLVRCVEVSRIGVSNK